MKFIVICVFLALGLVNCAPGRYVRTPHGLGWSECGYKIPSGSTIDVNEKLETVVITPDGTRIQHPPCPKPFIRKVRDLSGASSKNRDAPEDGWQIWASYNNKNNETFDSFLGYFNVPKDPSNWDGGILYMFTGLQNDNWIPYPSNGTAPEAFDIIQPVLQYGTTPAGGGNNWAIASWYVTVSENYLYSDLLSLNAGDNIFGNMTKTGPTTWYISGYSEDQKTNTSIYYNDPRLISQPWAYCTLEVYEIDDCAGDFPSSPMQFTKLSLTGASKNQVFPKWLAFNNEVDHCGASAVVNSATAVTFNFNT